jgi:hypothetical protein
MWHRFVYEQDKKKKQIQASLDGYGNRFCLHGDGKNSRPSSGHQRKAFAGRKNQSAWRVVIPTLKEIYNPVLEELKYSGVELHELHSS